MRPSKENDLKKLSEFTSGELTAISSDPSLALESQSKLLEAINYAEKAVPPISPSILEALKRKLQTVENIIASANKSPIEPKKQNAVKNKEADSTTYLSSDQQLIEEIINIQTVINDLIETAIKSGNLEEIELPTIEELEEKESEEKKEKEKSPVIVSPVKPTAFVGRSAPELMDHFADLSDKFKRLGFDVEYAHEGEGDKRRAIINVVSPKGYDKPIDPRTASREQIAEATAALRRSESKAPESKEKEAETEKPRIIHTTVIAPSREAAREFYKERLLARKARIRQQIFEMIGNLSTENNFIKDDLSFTKAAGTENPAPRIIKSGALNNILKDKEDYKSPIAEALNKTNKNNNGQQR